jgi:hypothetical protein
VTVEQEGIDNLLDVCKGRWRKQFGVVRWRCDLGVGAILVVWPLRPLLFMIIEVVIYITTTIILLT